MKKKNKYGIAINKTSIIDARATQTIYYVYYEVTNIAFTLLALAFLLLLLIVAKQDFVFRGLLGHRGVFCIGSIGRHRL